MEAREHSSSNRLPPIVVDKNKEISPILNQIEENIPIDTSFMKRESSRPVEEQVTLSTLISKSQLKRERNKSGN